MTRRKLDFEEANAIAMTKRPKDGKGRPLSIFTEFKGLLRLGRRPMLYLRWLQVTFLFMLVISLIEIVHTYFFYNAATTNNFFYRMSMANWNPTSTNSGSSTHLIILAVAEGILLIVMICYVRIFQIIRRKINNSSTHKFISVSDFSIHVRNVPESEVKYGTRRLVKFFNHFGKVVNVKVSWFF